VEYFHHLLIDQQINQRRKIRNRQRVHQPYTVAIANLDQPQLGVERVGADKFRIKGNAPGFGAGGATLGQGAVGIDHCGFG